MIIRQEKPSDYKEVYELVKMSFATVSDSDGTEPDYLNELRTKDTFIPELSLVAENESGKLVGQIVLYKIAIDKTVIVTQKGELIELLLSPISVHPDYFRRGIARALMERSFEIAKKLGFKAVFLCGDPKFYRKFGFIPTYEHGIYHATDKEGNADWCMVRELVSGALRNISGILDIV